MELPQNLLKFLSSGKSRMLVFALAGVAVVVVSILALHRYHTRNSQVYTIGVFYNSVNLQPGDVAVIKFLVGKRVDEINRKGGIAGYPVKAKFLDDEGSRQKARKLVQETISDPSFIAYTGLWGSTRVAAVADLVGEAGVPFIGGYSVTSLGARYPNMFSYEISVKQVAQTIDRLLKTRSVKLAMVGNTGDIYTEALFRELKALQAQEINYELVLEKWYPDEAQIPEKDLDLLLDTLQQQADFLLLSANPGLSNFLVKALGERQIRMPVFTAFADIPEIDHELPGFQEREFFDISVFGIPSALNMRCQQLEAQYKGQLEQSNRLLFQIGLGGLQADALGLLRAAAETSPAGELPIRQKIVQGLAGYSNGQQIFRGWFSDWYFTADRVLVNEVLLGWKPALLEKPVLAPVQYLHSEPGVKEAPVFYTSLDLQQIDQISDETGTFNASFFLEISANEPVSLQDLDFVNAVRNEVDQRPLLAVKVLKADTGRTDGFRFSYLYRITGRFYFKPALKAYPFDEQRFAISLQSNAAARPFLIQPPYYRQRDLKFSSPGWEFREHFVGFDQELIYSANPILRLARHVPSYKFSFSYVLKRTRVDFFLKILTPLLILLVIAYLAVFVPIREFVSVAVIQVTALLSAIALYFSAYKPAMAAATISDKIFIFTYVMITTMLGASVLQYWLYRRRREKRQLSKVISTYERFLFPLIVAGYVVFLIL